MEGGEPRREDGLAAAHLQRYGSRPAGLCLLPAMDGAHGGLQLQQLLPTSSANPVRGFPSPTRQELLFFRLGILYFSNETVTWGSIG